MNEIDNMKLVSHEISYQEINRLDTYIYETITEDKRYLWEYKEVNLVNVSKKLLDIEYIIIEPPPERPDFIKADEMKIY